MLDSTNKSQKDEHGYVDLSFTYSIGEEYVCEDCGIRLALFPQARIDNPHAGISYICPKCHNVIDSSLRGMQREDKIQPLEIAVPTFGIVPEKKGSEILFEPYDDHDPEPQEEERLKAQGATIISKKVEAKNDFG